MKSAIRLLLLIACISITNPLSAYVIDGTDAIYLAGRTDITVPPASDPWFFLLRHVNPTPEEAQETHPDFVPVVGGSVIRAVAPATGGVDFFNGIGFLYYPPDGNGLAGSNLSAIDGISGYIGPQGPLAGVFLDDSIPDTGPAPAALDFTPSGLGIDFSTLTPALGQVFFIGDGFNSVPAAQHFIAPAGATRLFLGIPDGFGFVGQPGAYDDNDGFYEIDLDVSLEVTIDIKFCSDPNAFNCKKKGVLPVTIFGTEDFFVEGIDFSSLQLCTEDLAFCTGAPRDWSFADRGTPSDAGAAQCALVEEPPLSGIFVEMDYLNPDTYLDVDVAFEASEVQDMLGAFCSADKGSISEPLVITGTTLDGVLLFSVPVPNVGIDQLLKSNK